MQLDIAQDYQPTDNELNNICYITCKCTIRWRMRFVDFQMCKSLTPDSTGPLGIERFIDATTEYLWDHISGEPEEFTAQELGEHIKPFIEKWYETTTQEERSETKEEEADGQN